MPQQGFLRGGHNKDLFIADLVEEHPDFIESFPFVLITYLDSSLLTSLKTVRRALAEHVDEFREVGSGVLLSGQQTIMLTHKYPLFTYFDEVWLFGEDASGPKPEGVSIVAPSNLSEEVPTEVAAWMYHSGCIVG